MSDYRCNLVTLNDYTNLTQKLNLLDEKDKIEICRFLGRNDLFFLLWFILKRNDIFKPWLLERCKEIESKPNGYLDLWAREHYKSTIITYALTIQDILSSHGDNPHPKWIGITPSIGIFSCTRPIAKSFLSQIKREFEQNTLLKSLYPDIFWTNPQKEAPKWSEDDGIILKRNSNQKESTIEAWGLVDSQPTSKHFNIRVYDDVVTLESVRSVLMLEKVQKAFEMSDNLGAQNGICRMIGTRYHFNDLYKHIIDNNIATPRLHTATINGEADGEPVLMTREALVNKRRTMGIYTFSTQMLLNPVKDSQKGFKREWVKYHNLQDWDGLNTYILVDPANSKKASADYTAIVVIGLGTDTNYYVLDITRDRLSLTERGNLLFLLHRKYRPIGVGYEQYGMQADIDYINDKMSRDKYSFNITPLHDGLKKTDRIEKLVPTFEQSRLLLPQHCHKVVNDKNIDLVETFLREEYDLFPVAEHDDVLDAMSRIQDEDLGAVFPGSYNINIDEFISSAQSCFGR